MTTLTLATIVVMAFGVIGSRGYGRALALGGATAAGAAIVVGSTAVPTFYAVALGTVAALCLQLLVNRQLAIAGGRRLPPAVPLLLLFLAWSTLVTFVAPVLFDGLAVPAPEGGHRLTAGVLTSSNIAQIIYLALGVCVVVFLARSSSAGPSLIGLAAGTTTLLSLWRTLHELAGLPFPEGVFDNSPFFVYIETAPAGVQRFRGILSEPSALAASSLVTICYMLPRSLWLTGWRRAGALFVAGAAAYLGAISTSATFVVAGGAVALIAAITFGCGFLMRRKSVSAIVSVATCAMVILALWVLPIVFEFVEATVNEKVSSSSYAERSGTDARSFEIFLETFGLGVGLGASRASSFFAGLLSTAGLIGTLLFTAAVVHLIRRGADIRRYRPVVWALVACLVLKVTAGPDLSDSSGILWISLGLLSHAALSADARRAAVPTNIAAALRHHARDVTPATPAIQDHLTLPTPAPRSPATKPTSTWPRPN